jgi:hypothetical protein
MYVGRVVGSCSGWAVRLISERNGMEERQKGKNIYAK